MASTQPPPPEAADDKAGQKRKSDQASEHAPSPSSKKADEPAPASSPTELRKGGNIKTRNGSSVAGPHLASSSVQGSFMVMDPSSGQPIPLEKYLSLFPSLQAPPDQLALMFHQYQLMSQHSYSYPPLHLTSHLQDQLPGDGAVTKHSGLLNGQHAEGNGVDEPTLKANEDADQAAARAPSATAHSSPADGKSTPSEASGDAANSSSYSDGIRNNLYGGGVGQTLATMRPNGFYGYNGALGSFLTPGGGAGSQGRAWPWPYTGGSFAAARGSVQSGQEGSGARGEGESGRGAEEEQEGRGSGEVSESQSQASSEGMREIEDLLSRLNPLAREFVPPPSPAATSPSLPAFSPHGIPSSHLLPPPFLLAHWSPQQLNQQQEPQQSQKPFQHQNHHHPHYHQQQQQQQQQQGHEQHRQSRGATDRHRGHDKHRRALQGPPPPPVVQGAMGPAAGPGFRAGAGTMGAGGRAAAGAQAAPLPADRNPRNGRPRPDVSIPRTIYVSDLDQEVTEEQLAELFQECGQVVDCRICGDPNSMLRFAFVEFTEEGAAKKALGLGGTVLGLYRLRVLPSKTPILPVNPRYLPKSNEERELCARTVYCTNIDRKVTQIDVKQFFESLCGEVSKLRLLGDHNHNTRIAFVEFVQADSATAALNCSGAILGSLPIRVSPSKTPVRPRLPKYDQQPQ